MKEIIMKINGKKIYQFVISDLELVIAKKLGLTEEQYIKEKAIFGLDNKKKRNKSFLMQKSGDNWIKTCG